MPSTRSATRSDDASPKKEEVAAGSKRKAEATSPTRSRKATKQSTIEETIAGQNTEDPPTNPIVDAQMDDTTDGNVDDNQNGEQEKSETETKTKETDKTDGEEKNGTNEHGNKKEAEGDNGDTVQPSSQREKRIASNILEKGIVYFFTRNRVGIEDSDSVGDLQRTFFVLRPLPIGTKLGKSNDDWKIYVLMSGASQVMERFQILRIIVS